MLAHIAQYGLRCPGADEHRPHPVGSVSDLTADHIVPRNRGGKDVRSNLRVVCASYNSSRGDRPVMDYRSEIRLGQRAEVDAAKNEPKPTPPPPMKVVTVSAPRAEQCFPEKGIHVAPHRGCPQA